MKAILIIVLLTFALCVDNLEGGWEKRSIYENSIEIDEVFRQAYKEYSKTNSAELDDLLRLTIYTQVVSGTNYKLCFIDLKADYRTIHEYVFYKPLAVNNNGLNEYLLQEHKQYDVSNEIITSNDPKYTIVENEFIKKLKKTNEKFNYISYIYLAENEETSFYMISACTDGNEHQYIFCQEKKTEEFYIFNRIN